MRFDPSESMCWKVKRAGSQLGPRRSQLLSSLLVGVEADKRYGRKPGDTGQLRQNGHLNDPRQCNQGKFFFSLLIHRRPVTTGTSFSYQAENFPNHTKPYNTLKCTPCRIRKKAVTPLLRTC
jgi:hypothetical protein